MRACTAEVQQGGADAGYDITLDTLRRTGLDFKERLG